jgi:H+/Cl- antiporter ClcA
MAIIMIFELTLDYQIILPLMLACVLAYYTSVKIEKRSIYAEALKRKGAGDLRKAAGRTARSRFNEAKPADDLPYDWFL